MQLAEKCQSVAFKLVYIAEAHASDEWPIGNAYQMHTVLRGLRQTTTLEARCRIAQQLVDDFRITIPVLVDDPATDDFQKRFEPWPFRYVVVAPNGQCTCVSQTKDAFLDLAPLARLLGTI
jgi:hypothetical protein